MILLSLIVPVYNCEKTIKRTLDSILPQLTNEIELIIVNDGSKDTSLDVIEKIITNKTNVKLISKQNEGVFSARKTGYDASTGLYIWNIDGGDEICDESIKVIIDEIKRSKKDLYIINYKTIVGNEVRYSDFKESKDYIKAMFLGQEPITIWSKIYKKELGCKNLNAKYNKVLMGEDLIQSIDILTAAKNISVLKKPLYSYIIDSNSTTISNKANISIINALRACKEILTNCNIYDDNKYEFEYLLFNQLIIRYSLIKKQKNTRKIFVNEYKNYKVNAMKNKYIGIKGIMVIIAKIESMIPTDWSLVGKIICK